VSNDGIVRRSGMLERLSVGIDIGGTFTDLVLIDDASGERAIGKVLTTPDDPSEAVEQGLRGLLEHEDVDASQLKTIIHGTTLVTNALIERRGTATALLTTEGFRDAVAIGTEHRYDMYDIFLEKPEPLVPRSLRYGVRERVHLALLPMEDRQENAAIVNALQRHATIVVQKSLAEGFGLTVAEGMWKGRPLVASAVGGIADQVVDGETGVLVRDAADLREYGEALVRVLSDPEEGDRMGELGRRRVLEHFIGVRHLRQWVELVDRLDAGGR